MSQAVVRRRVRVTVRAAILVGLVAILSVAWVYPVRLWMAQRTQIATLEQQTAQLRNSNAALEAEVKKLRDSAYLEQLARECLGMVGKGEIAFVIVPKDGQPRADSCSLGGWFDGSSEPVG